MRMKVQAKERDGKYFVFLKDVAAKLLKTHDKFS